MAAVGVGGSHHVKQERFHIIVQGFVVQKRLGDQTEVLTVLLVLFPTHLHNWLISNKKYFFFRNTSKKTEDQTSKTESLSFL